MSASRLSLRRLEGESLDAADAARLRWLVEMDARCFGRPWTAAQWASEVANPRAWVWVAERGRRRVGYANLWALDETWELQRIAVDPALRGQGHGRDLLVDLLVRAAREGARACVLEVASRNSAAQSLYAGLGFEKVGRRPDYYSDPPDDAEIWRLEPIG